MHCINSNNNKNNELFFGFNMYTVKDSEHVRNIIAKAFIVTVKINLLHGTTVQQ